LSICVRQATAFSQLVKPDTRQKNIKNGEIRIFLWLYKPAAKVILLDIERSDKNDSQG
jgi:hypothetical protein